MVLLHIALNNVHGVRQDSPRISIAPLWKLCDVFAFKVSRSRSNI